jgi:hypothetical protein
MGIKICPRCESKNISLCTSDAWGIAIGSASSWKCNDCRLVLPEFPESKDKIKKNNKEKIK